MEALTERESVLWDAMLSAGYTERQAARALVALTLPEPSAEDLTKALPVARRAYPSQLNRYITVDAIWLQVEAERRGYLPKPGVTP